MVKGTTLSAYKPSWRDQIAWAMSDAFGGGDRSKTNYINEKVRGAVDMVPFVGDAVSANDAVRSYEAGNYGQAALEGGTAALGAVPGLGDALVTGGKALGLGLAGKSFYNAMKKGYKHSPNQLNVFAGPTAKTADKRALERAQDMAYDGRDATEIFRKEGWFQGPDNMWRFEIPDDEAYVGLDVTRGGKEGRAAAAEDLTKYGFSVDPREPDMLDGVLHHPRLFEAYPKMRDYGVLDIPHNAALGGFHANPKQSLGIRPGMVDGGIPPAYIEAKTNKYINPTDTEFNKNIDPLSTMLHEIQHGIQAKEGFDPGFNPQAAFETSANPDSFVSQTLNKAWSEFENSPALLNARMVGKSEEEMQDSLLEKISFETYKRNMGEVEARNVQARAMHPYYNNIGRLPTSTADRFPEEQLRAHDILYGSYGPEGVPGLSLRGPARKLVQGFNPQSVPMSDVTPASQWRGMFHGTKSPLKFDELSSGIADPSRGVGANPPDVGIHVTPDPDVAAMYAGITDTRSATPEGMTGGRVYPVLVNKGKTLKGNARDGTEIYDGSGWFDPYSVEESLDPAIRGGVPDTKDILADVKSGLPLDEALKRRGYGSMDYLHRDAMDPEGSFAPSTMITDKSRIVPKFSSRGLSLSSTPKRPPKFGRHMDKEDITYMQDLMRGVNPEKEGSFKGWVAPSSGGGDVDKIRQVMIDLPKQGIMPGTPEYATALRKAMMGD